MKPRAKTPNSRGQMNIAKETTLTFAIDDVNDRITYNSTQSQTFLFLGVADVSVSNACSTVLRLYKNGTGIEATDTPHTFTSPSKVGTVSSFGLLSLNKGDFFEVWAKSDTAGITITFYNLRICLFGEN